MAAAFISSPLYLSTVYSAVADLSLSSARHTDVLYHTHTWAQKNSSGAQRTLLVINVVESLWRDTQTPNVQDDRDTKCTGEDLCEVKVLHCSGL